MTEDKIGLSHIQTIPGNQIYICAAIKTRTLRNKESSAELSPKCDVPDVQYS